MKRQWNLYCIDTFHLDELASNQSYNEIQLLLGPVKSYGHFKLPGFFGAGEATPAYTLSLFLAHGGP